MEGLLTGLCGRRLLLELCVQLFLRPMESRCGPCIQVTAAIYGERKRASVLSSQYVCGWIKLQMILFLLKCHTSKRKKNPDVIQDVWWRLLWSCLQSLRLKTISTQTSNFSPISDLIYIHIYMLENTNRHEPVDTGNKSFTLLHCRKFSKWFTFTSLI